MLRNPLCSRAIAVALLFIPLSLSTSFAHCFVGARFFPATLATDDPCVADEMSLPTVAWSRTSDVPPAQRMGHLGENCTSASPRISASRSATPGRRSASRAAPRWPVSPISKPRFQYQLLKNDSHELAMLLGLIVDWGGTGATNSGIGTSYSVLTPTYYFGKGFGDLPDERRLAARLRGDRPGRLSDSDNVLRRSRKTPSFRRCWSMADRCNTACRT